MRNFWLKVHLFIALTVGFVFVILGLTGSVNVFMTELEEIGLPKVEQNTSAKPVSLTQIMATVKAAHPQREDRWTLSMPGHDRDYIWVGYAKPKETADEFFAPLRVLVHPYTGEIVSQSFWGQTIWSLIYEMHADLLMGKLGTDIGKTAFKIVCFLGIFLLVSALTGLYFWWPKNHKKFNQSITIKRHASKQRFYFDLHNITGFYSAIFLLITAFSGISFAYYKDYIKPIVALFSEVKADHHKEPKELKSKRNESAEPITPDQA
ncbi:MAG: PepSY-associated TM helix domain-containing protein, partial [Methylococcales bacterium]